MPEIRTETQIDASPDTVWKILTDIPGHKEWNTVFRDFSGTAEKGRGVRLKLEVSGKLRAFAAKVLDCNAPTVFAWGTPPSPLSILIGARHYFELHPAGNSKTKLVHGERFTGLIPLLAWPLIRKVKPQYEQFNEQLKTQSEKVQLPE